MKRHASTIAGEVKRMIADWDGEGEIDLLDFFAELTIYTSSARLVGNKFRDRLDGRFARLYHDSERGTDPLCYLDPYLPIESFRRRDDALLQIPCLENVIKETLRLHPPLIILMRVAKLGLNIQGYRIRDGDLVGTSPAISNRISGDFSGPDVFAPERYEQPRQEDLLNRWTWIPFGAGRHRCVGAAFATMQLKAIFSVLLREYEFELAQPPDSYHNDHSKMVVQLAQPARVRYRRLSARGA
jgi:cytochrome P450